MAKMRMMRIRLIAHRSDRKPLLETLQWMGVLDIEAAAGPDGPALPEGFVRPDTRSGTASFERAAAVASGALGILNEAAPESRGLLAGLSGRREITADDFDRMAEDSRAVMDICHQVLDWQKRRIECEAEILRLSASLEQMEPWKTLDVPFRFRGTRTTAAFIGVLPALYTEDGLRECLAEREPEAAFEAEVLAASPEQTCLFLLCRREDAPGIEQALRSLGFSRPPATAGTSKHGMLPSDEIDRLSEKRRALEEEAAAITRKLEEAAADRRRIENTIDYYTIRAEKYRIIGELGHTKHTFLVSGYIPEPDLPLLRERLEERFAVLMEVEEAKEDTAPVKLHNNAFARPAEAITEMYALPLASDMDPTPVMSFFYYLFFGMMLSDAGYGLLLALGSWLLIKKCRPEPGLRRNLKLFLYCGISTMAWGFAFGSFFGDAIPIISRTFFGHEVNLPRLLDPMTQAVQMLILSLGLGFVHILAGMGCKFYLQWKSGDPLGAVFDTGFWMTGLLGIVLWLAGGYVSPVMSAVGMWLTIASVAGLLLTAGRKKKGPMKVLAGLVSLYDSTGYISDLMSYSRLMALALTTGAMASVFNLMGTIMGGGIGGAIMMLIIFPVGHLINFGLNALGAYVHTIRLQYVEMFSKFYEGGGRPFRPFALRSQYIRIKEEPKQ